jgi:S-adenosylmethionine-diacylglycerol 3-amino-3-carboxypropyl transferase
MSRIESRARFDLIRYANSWEDADVLCDALHPAPGKRMLAIASAGDNAFALLAAGAEVVAVDLSAAQLALVELKRAAIRALDDDALLRFLGVREASDRVEVYRALELPDDVRAWWDAHLDAIASGVIHAGRFENYFRLFRRYVLPLVHTKRDVERLLAANEDRVRFYEREWNTWRWRALFRLFFSRFVMGRTGRDPEFFRYVEGSVAQRIFARAEYAMTTLVPRENPYLTFILTGNFGDVLPRYLRDLDRLRRNLDKLTLVRGSIEEGARGKFDGFYLSDIFEYVDPQTQAAMYGRLLDAANPHARFAYWNLLVPRKVPEQFASRVVELREEAHALFARDKAFFYGAFVLECGDASRRFG